jgi:hypothetical protein
VKKALAIALVVVVLMTGLPIFMGMSDMATCRDCGPAFLHAGAGCTLAVLVAGFTLLLVFAAQRLRDRNDILRLQWHAFLLERPPRLA